MFKLFIERLCCEMSNESFLQPGANKEDDFEQLCLQLVYSCVNNV